jgi:hypothetical protein
MSRIPISVLAVGAAAFSLVGSPAVAQELPFNATYFGTTQIVGATPGPAPVIETMSIGISADAPYGLTTNRAHCFLRVLIDRVIFQGTSDFISNTIDALFATVDGTATLPDPTTGISVFEGTAVFVGGTGRFENAGGSAHLSGEANTVANTFVITFQGTISVVPEPSALVLSASGVGIAAFLQLGRRRRGRDCRRR